MRVLSNETLQPYSPQAPDTYDFTIALVQPNEETGFLFNCFQYKIFTICCLYSVIEFHLPDAPLPTSLHLTTFFTLCLLSYKLFMFYTIWLNPNLFFYQVSPGTWSNLPIFCQKSIESSYIFAYGHCYEQIKQKL